MKRKRRFIGDQPYVPGMTCAEIDFFTQYMGSSLIRERRLNDETASESELRHRLAEIRDPYYLTMKQASIRMPNGRIAQVSRARSTVTSCVGPTR
jgi:hypothetical protein